MALYGARRFPDHVYENEAGKIGLALGIGSMLCLRQQLRILTPRNFTVEKRRRRLRPHPN